MARATTSCRTLDQAVVRSGVSRIGKTIFDSPEGQAFRPIQDITERVLKGNLARSTLTAEQRSVAACFCRFAAPRVGGKYIREAHLYTLHVHVI
jgi:hypothetical protein